MASATGESFSASGFNCHAAKTSTAEAITVKAASEADGEFAFGEGAIGGAGIAAIEFEVGDAVHGHGGGARADHGDDDPEKLPPGGKGAAGASGEQRADQREGQRENGVLELDHFEHDADAVVSPLYSSLRRAGAPPFQRYCFSCGKPSCARTRKANCSIKSSIFFGA